VTPALLLLLLGTHGEAPISSVLGQLSLEVLLPLVVGQAVRLLARQRTAVFAQLRQIPSMLLLYLIFCVFCATFSSPMPADAGRDIAIAVVGSALLHGLLLALGWWLAGWRALRLDHASRLAALFCATQKTIALGVPMLSILYGHHPDLAWLTLPLLCYHPLQLVAGGILAARLRAPPAR
jgi:sodium/bile acid cotransporter 7